MTVEATITKARCTARCWKSKGVKCRCSCGGDNHGINKNATLWPVEPTNKAATEKR